MKDGYKIIDMDTHVNPSTEVLKKYADPDLRPRFEELNPYYSERIRHRPDGTVQTSMGMNWPIWSALDEKVLRKYMYDNAAKFLRLI